MSVPPGFGSLRGDALLVLFQSSHGGLIGEADTKLQHEMWSVWGSRRDRYTCLVPLSPGKASIQQLGGHPVLCIVEVAVMDGEMCFSLPRRDWSLISGVSS